MRAIFWTLLALSIALRQFFFGSTSPQPYNVQQLSDGNVEHHTCSKYSVHLNRYMFKVCFLLGADSLMSVAASAPKARLIHRWGSNSSSNWGILSYKVSNSYYGPLKHNLIGWPISCTFELPDIGLSYQTKRPLDDCHRDVRMGD